VPHLPRLSLVLFKSIFFNEPPPTKVFLVDAASNPLSFHEIFRFRDRRLLSLFGSFPNDADPSGPLFKGSALLRLFPDIANVFSLWRARRKGTNQTTFSFYSRSHRILFRSGDRPPPCFSPEATRARTPLSHCFIRRHSSPQSPYSFDHEVFLLPRF